MNGREQLEKILKNLRALGAQRLAALGVVGLAVFAAVGLGSYYLSRPDMATLYTGLNSQDISRIGAALKEAGIAFDVDADGTKIMVGYGQTAQARMLLAEKGLPSSATAGYELFDKLGTMGLSSFMQEVTRVRALEGEIARTIQGMKGVKAARVHIVMPDSGSFRRSRQPPSASVVIRTEADGDFGAAAAIRHLVAAAVPGMTVDEVSVLNTDGTVLAAGGDLLSAAPGKMIDLEKTISNELQENVRKTLAPYLGLDNFQISVAARLNMDKRQVNETAYDPESRFERSVRTVKETGSSQDGSRNSAVGVEQNIPAEETQTQTGGDQTRRQNERREELKNFDINTKTTSVVSEGYRVENLTIAVVINRKRLLATLGENPSPEAVEHQLKEVEGLVSSAAGVDVKRGDRITVAAVEFMPNTQMLEPQPGLSLAEQLIQHTGSFLRSLTILGVTMLLIWFGLRPATRALLDAPKPMELAAAAEMPSLPSAGDIPEFQIAPHLMAKPEPDLVGDLADRMGRGPQKRLEQMIDLDEEQAVAVLKQWLRS
jgi:flagellar M-ring protein FliF